MDRIIYAGGTAASNSITVSNVGWGDITGASSDTSYRVVMTSPVGTESTLTAPTPIRGEKRISPSLYFKFVKSKLQKNELEILKLRLTKLSHLVKETLELGQEALHEDLAKSLAIAVRESEALACGFDTWVSIKDISKFREIVKESGANKSPVYFKKLDEFPRPIPYDPAKIIKKVRGSKLFDEYWILYLDYVGVELKTNKEKIRQKDPIIFGQFAYAKDRYYYITDWVDEYCDLTMQEFVRKLKTNDPEYRVNETAPMDEKFMERIKAEVLARHERLDGAKPSNFRDLMKEEDQAKLKKKPWYKRIFG